MKHWLILWKTWTTDTISTPWPFTIYKQEIDYKSKKDQSSVDLDTVHAIYETLNADKISKFENEHISADILATVLQDINEESAFNQVKKIFTDAALEKCVEVSADDAKKLIDSFIEE